MKRIRTPFTVWLIYAGLTIVMTWPLAAQLGTHIPGLVGDSFVHLWTFEWIKESLLAGRSPFYTEMLFYPNGTTLIFHNIAWLNIAVWLPLQTLIGGAAAYTLIHIGVLTLNGLTTFLLAREVTESDLAAFVAGLVCAFWPFTMSHQDHPNLIFITWVPMVLLYLRRMFAHGRTRDALLVSLFLILTGIARWQVLIMASPLVGLYVLYALIAYKPSRTWHTFKLLLLIGGLTTLFLLPLILPLVAAQFTRAHPRDLFVDEYLLVTDLWEFLVPSRYHPLWGSLGFYWSRQLAGNLNYVAFLGFTTIILAVIGFIGAWHKARFWLLAAVAYIILTLGPNLVINGRVFFPLPYTLIQNFFIAQAIRHPERLNVILSIPVAVLVGLGVTVLLRVRWVAGHAKWVTAVLSLLILFEYIITFPSLPLTTPDWYAEIAQEPGDFAIVDIPMHMRQMYDKTYMFYQFTHKRPLIEGHVSRPPRQAFDFIKSIPMLADSYETRLPPPNVGDISHQMQLLAEADIRYVVLHKRFLRDSHEAAWRSWLTVTPDFEDEDIIVYKTAPAVLDEKFSLAQPMVQTADGQSQFGLIRTVITPTQSIQGGWVLVDAWWGGRSPLPDDVTVCLNLENNTHTLTARCDLLAPDRPTSQWDENEIMWTQHLFQMQPDWPAGDYQLTFSLQDELGEMVGETAVLTDFTLQELTRTFKPPQSSKTADAHWQDLFNLEGYDLNQRTDQLEFTLYWHALQSSDISYKIFLHLTDAETGELVAQLDFLPQNWSYPTHWWQPGEYIPDPVSLEIGSLPPGQYHVWLGLYHPDSGERLPLTNAAGQPYPNAAYPLTTITLCVSLC
ncbi:MAG: hypothetical protein GY796_03785 [Chloroflexi bacterium]|nr:hypothetical protein [Chloroflexota bacterium]